MKKLICILGAIMIAIGCSAKSPETKVTYGEWGRNSFLVSEINGDTAKINVFFNHELIKIDIPNKNYKVNDLLTLNWRRVETITCTDHNCTLEETYEVKE